MTADFILYAVSLNFKRKEKVLELSASESDVMIEVEDLILHL